LLCAHAIIDHLGLAPEKNKASENSKAQATITGSVSYSCEPGDSLNNENTLAGAFSPGSGSSWELS
jgi:hypothetical protein